MILLVDIGNSLLKYASLEGGNLTVHGSIDYHASELTSSSLAIGARTPDAIFLISVADKSIERDLAVICNLQWGLHPQRLGSKSHCAGVTNGYADPETLGADRWAAMIGAYTLLQGAVVVVDCGSACTTDIIDACGQHQGGGIAPGIRMMQQALWRETARIQHVDSMPKIYQPGVTTTECIHYGTTEALCGFIERVTQRTVKLYGAAVTVVVTGGDAPLLIPYLQQPVRYEKDLVFIGMAAMVQERTKRESV